MTSKLDVQPFLVLDDRLDVSDKISYGIVKGGASITSNRFPAVAQDASQHTYNVIVPSKDTIVPREVLWSSTVTLTLTTTDIPIGYTAGGNLVQLGVLDAIGPFPLNNACQTMSARINGNSVSASMQNILPQLLRINNKGDLLAYNGTCPTAFDTFANYYDSYLFVSSSLGGIDNSPDENDNMRGSFPIELGPVMVNGVATGDGELPSGAGSIIAGTVYSQTVTFTSVEPLLISPFLFGNPESNKAGFFGLQNMSLTMSMGNNQRFWRHAVQKSGDLIGRRNWNLRVSNVAYDNSELLFTFISRHPDMQLPERSVTPYYELPHYILTQPNFPTVNPSASVDIISNALSLNNIPDKMIICVRKPMINQTCQDTDSWFSINSISMQFANIPGLLSNMTPQQLWKSSRDSGSNQSWLEYSGKAHAGGILDRDVSTSGSLLVLDVGKHLALNNPKLAAGLANSSFTVSFTINVTNNYDVAVNPELVLMCMNSGVFVIENNKSSIDLNVLTEEMVIDAHKVGNSISQSSLKRLVGGGFLDNIKSAWRKASPFVQKGIAFADNLSKGSGMSANGLSGQGESASGLKKRSLKDRLKY